MLIKNLLYLFIKCWKRHNHAEACTNPGHQVTVAPKIFTVVHRIFPISFRFLRWLINLSEICVCLFIHHSVYALYDLIQNLMVTILHEQCLQCLWHEQLLVNYTIICLYLQWKWFSTRYCELWNCVPRVYFSLRIHVLYIFAEWKLLSFIILSQIQKDIIFCHTGNIIVYSLSLITHFNYIKEFSCSCSSKRP